MNFSDEIVALDANFYVFYYKIESNWTQDGEIDFKSVRSLWDLIKNVQESLISKDVNLPQIDEAVLITDGMNAIVSQVVKDSDAIEDEFVFNGTEEQYSEIGRKIQYSLLELEPHIVSARVELSEMSQ
ncbi:MAG: hypothetical protein ABI947_13065 [Chloroflexota bacterium]